MKGINSAVSISACPDERLFHQAFLLRMPNNLIPRSTGKRGESLGERSEYRILAFFSFEKDRKKISTDAGYQRHKPLITDPGWQSFALVLSRSKATEIFMAFAC